MHHTEQAHLPGGSLGSPVTNEDGTRTWSAPPEPGSSPSGNERTARWDPDEGWFVVDHDASGRAVERTGPWRTTDELETALCAQMAVGNEQEEGEAQVHRIVAEGLRVRVLEAAERVVQAAGGAATIDALSGRRRVPGRSGRHRNLEPAGEDDTAEARTTRERFEDLIEATERWRIWNTSW